MEKIHVSARWCHEHGYGFIFMEDMAENREIVK